MNVLKQWFQSLNKIAVFMTIGFIIAVLVLTMLIFCFPVFGAICCVLIMLSTICSFVYVLYTFFDMLTEFM